MANLNIKFNNKNYSIDSAALADATARLEAHLASMVEERLEGDGAEFYTLAPTALSFRSTAPLNELQEVQINGVTVDPANYTLEEGSTIVTFPIEYLKTLEKGNYEVDVVSTSKSVKGGFTVAAPELNEYGFYYNQPYCAFVPMFNENEAFFIREGGIMDIIGATGSINTATYSISGNTITVVTSVVGTLTGTISADGTEIFCNELQISFKLDDISIVADEDYIYINNHDNLSGYAVGVIDKTKTSYGTIKTGINGIDTVALASNAFYSCKSLVDIVIPNSITCIGGCAFSSCESLASITIPNSVTTIEMAAFTGCTSLTDISFNGTMEQWNAITKGGNWNQNVPATHVHCIDGDVAL